MGGGGARSTPGGSASQGGGGTGEACTQSQGHRPGWPVAGLEKSVGRGPSIWDQLGYCCGQTMDWTPRSQPESATYPLSEQSKERNQKD